MRTRSIISRVTGHYRRGAFWRTVFTDILVIGAVQLTWLCAMESTLAGFPFLHGVQRTFSFGGMHASTIPWDWFAGTTYSVTIGEVRHTFPMNGILAVLLIGMVLVVLCQILLSLITSAVDRHAVRSILKPIDDVAMLAERLSSETRAKSAQAETQAAEKSVEAGRFRDIETALDHIDDLSGDARISVRDSELSGLEAAVNNMLKRLAASQKKQIRFVDDASHELRTPIAVIQGYAHMLERWGKDDPAVMDEAIEAIETETAHMKTLVDQLLFLARGDMDRLVLAQERIDAAGLMRELHEEYEMIDADHEYVCPIPEDAAPLYVVGDVTMLKQALRVLLDNAGKYTPKKGTITLQVQRDGSEIRCSVADNGVGIPSDDLPRIFDRFFRGATARSGTQGSGLGLSIAKWIVDTSGGRIDVVSAPELGTKMTIVLPELPAGAGDEAAEK
ncbi:MAG: HAMP domain-containing sensor histidine kinase [Eubacteriales bacterium]|nr:HAMP domain-containing histidine kinase [Clostridiales bacterium]MDD7773398.1 HAMP domain-containing sensor histidine kinase [Eubacteriales bacterium]MDY3942311.1 HAMP domain-containing sensor histidine kinase [Eubacteriales bacterium]